MLVLSAALATAQSAGPYAAYVFPAGGQRGTTFTVTVAGQNLGNPLGAEVSGGGVSVRVLGFIGKAGPLTKVQEEELRRRLQELTGARPARRRGIPQVQAPAEKVELPDLPELRNLESRTKPQLRLVVDQFLNRDKRPKPPMDELVTLEITLAAGAASGDRALRLRTRNGLTNPLVFQVGTAPETREPGRFEEPPAEPPLLALPVGAERPDLSRGSGSLSPGPESGRGRGSLRRGAFPHSLPRRRGARLVPGRSLGFRSRRR